MLALKFNDFLLYISWKILVCGISKADATIATPNCGASTAAKHIQLVHPQTPPRVCSYHINAYNNNVCQLRIDFSMILAQPSLPDQNGLWYVQCTQDYFEVNDLKFCGSETAQHIYVPFNGTARIDLRIILLARNSSNKSLLPTPEWNMLITQLECQSQVRQKQIIVDEAKANNLLWTRSSDISTEDDLLVAPPSCLQYFPHTSGTILSFNYAGGAGVYTGNLNYAICFRRQHETRMLNIQVHYFNLGAEYSRQKFYELDNYCRPQLHSEGLSEDYLLIPQAIIKNSNINATYFCGNSIQGDTVISTNPGPLLLIFHSDSNYKPEREVGFALSYNIV
ncbi:uncharacterized protein [Eurosta solidaginis]|uniref:uncharacterized protein n=1 Tax=Eurosta solidaginis TaxID=178769 RepID=UPI003531569D